MKIPLVDLKAQYQTIQKEMDAAIAGVLRDTAFIGGPALEQFEKDFAAYCGVKHALGLGTGTDALHLALRACGIGAGDEVITVPNTFFATVEAVFMTGASVRFVDVDPKTHTMDVHQLEKTVTRKTKAIVPVHLYGRPAEMDPILELAKAKSLTVIGDACQAHGAAYNGKKIGTLGGAVAYSFYPGKNLGAYGDGGALVTNDDKIAEQVSRLRDHGRADKYEHLMSGFNCRLDGLQAAILGAKLPHLEDWTENRRKHAGTYRKLLADSGLTLPSEDGDSRHVYHLFVVEVDDRDAVLKHLHGQGIGAGIHYPIPLHQQPALKVMGLKEGSFPVTERLAPRILSLPLFPELTEEQINFVAEQLRNAVAV